MVDIRKAITSYIASLTCVVNVRESASVYVNSLDDCFYFHHDIDVCIFK